MLAKHIYEINKKIIRGLQKYGAPPKNKGYLKIEVPNLRELAKKNRT